jgi:hypothetical protein
MRRIAGQIMREGGTHRARTIGFALVAGFVAFEAALAFGTGAVGIPGIILLRLAGEGGGAHLTEIAENAQGGESVVAKPGAPANAPERQEAPQTGEPRLDGLIDIPLQEWVRDKPKAPEGKAFGAEAEAHGDLPWDAIEPVPFSPVGPGHATADATAALPRQAQPDVPPTPLPPVAFAELPPAAAVESWVKAKAMEIKGEDRGRPLFHFEFWLDAPDDVKQRLAAVAYEFNTPAVMPQSQISTEKTTGFRVNAGGLTCADSVTIKLKFNDGRTQQVAVDGCKLLS